MAKLKKHVSGENVKEVMGRFEPCVCKTEDTHMPAVAVVCDNPDGSRRILIESVRTDYKTDDFMDAYRQAVEDYRSAVSQCKSKGGWEQRIQCVVSSLKEKGYLLTPKTVHQLVLDSAEPVVYH